MINQTPNPISFCSLHSDFRALIANFSIRQIGRPPHLSPLSSLVHHRENRQTFFMCDKLCHLGDRLCHAIQGEDECYRNTQRSTINTLTNETPKERNATRE